MAIGDRRQPAPILNDSIPLKNKRVLAVGNGSSKLAASAPALRREGLEVDRVSSSETALELARHVRFHLALLDYPGSGIGVRDLARGLVAAGLPDHRVHVVLVASPDKIEEARAYVGDVVDAVLSADATPEESAQVLHEILGASPRVSVRFPVRVEVHLEGGPSLVFRQTENLSATGMLIRSPRVLPVGTEVSFRLDLPGAQSPVEGRARVVRHALDVETQTVLATGLRFVSFKGEDDVRLRSFLARGATGVLRS
jgi:CheY-like chemotaxis protein